MLICAIITWGKDLLIKPVESLDYVRNLKRRLNLDDVDYIVYDSGFFTPISFDNFKHDLNESEQVELFGNELHRHRAWDEVETEDN